MVEKVKACLLTGALGDAYGGRFEQMDLPAGDDQWSFSDDTQLTMATAEAIMESGEVLPSEVATAFQRWYRAGKLSGLGASTLTALVELISGKKWTQVGATGEMSAGNGAAMRIAPLAFLLDPSEEKDREIIRNVCWITHQNEEAFAGALAVIYAIRFIQNDRQNYIQQLIRHLPESNLRNRLEEISQSPQLTIRQIGRKYGTSGFVVESVPLALFAAQQARTIGIQSMMKEIVAAGGDSDTNCSIAGQVAGVGLGIEAIPTEWMTKLRETPGYGDHYETIRAFAEFVGQARGIKTLF